MTATIFTKESASRSRSSTHLVSGGLTALVVASALALGVVSSASAVGTIGTWDEGHVDFVHVSLAPGTNDLQLGSNVDGGDYYPASLVNASSGTPGWDVTVNQNDSGDWVIPDQLTSGYVYAGFAGADEDLDGADSLLTYLGIEDTVTLTLEVVSAPTSGDVVITWPGGIPDGVESFSGDGSASDPYVIEFAINEDEEAFHQHPQIQFTEDGTYKVEVEATSSDSAVDDADPVTYQFVTN